MSKYRQLDKIQSRLRDLNEVADMLKSLDVSSMSTTEIERINSDLLALIDETAELGQKLQDIKRQMK